MLAMFWSLLRLVFESMVYTIVAIMAASLNSGTYGLGGHTHKVFREFFQHEFSSAAGVFPYTHFDTN